MASEAAALAQQRVVPVSRLAALLGLRVTFSGLLCLVVILLIGVAAQTSEANLLLLLAGISCGILLFSVLASARTLRGVSVERVTADAVIAGRPFKIAYLLHSHRRWFRAWSLIVQEAPTGGHTSPPFPRGFLRFLPPGGQRRIELSGMCPHRGKLELTGIRLTSRFPFGLFACTVTLPAPAALVIYPAVGRLPRDLWRGRAYASSASSRQNRHSDGHDEFYGVREYRPGDNLRWIHWRRSAHTGKLVVREMMPVREAQLIVLVDPWPGETAGPRRIPRRRLLPDPDVERVISAAATALCEGLERGHRVGLICRSAVPVFIAPAGGRPHRQRLLHELALLEPGPAPGLDELIARIRWSSGWHARCLICATRLGEVHDRVAKFLEQRAEAVMVVSSESETSPVMPVPSTGEPVAAGRSA